MGFTALDGGEKNTVRWSEQTKRKAILYVVKQLGRVQAAILKHTIGESFWVSQDGSIKTYRELDDYHLNNIIRKIKREDRQRDKLPGLYAERKRREKTARAERARK